MDTPMSRPIEMAPSKLPPPVWTALRDEARSTARNEAALAGLLATAILNHGSLGDALGHQLARKLEDQDVAAMALRDVIRRVYEADPSIVEAAEDDLRAVLERDPACAGYVKPFLFFKGFLALQTHRVAHALHEAGREALSLYLRSRSGDQFDVDIHPTARIGRGVFIDHGTGIVIGEAAVIGDGVSMLQGVTVGGGVHHPRIGKGVLLSAGARVLGNITIGDHAKIAASSVVLSNVPEGCTAVGVPARLVNCPTCEEPAQSMDQGVPGFS